MSERLIAIAARFRESEAEQINNWRRQQARIPNMAEAMRILSLRGLSLPATEAGALSEEKSV